MDKLIGLDKGIRKYKMEYFTVSELQEIERCITEKRCDLFIEWESSDNANPNWDELHYRLDSLEEIAIKAHDIAEYEMKRMGREVLEDGSEQEL